MLKHDIVLVGALIFKSMFLDAKIINLSNKSAKSFLVRSKRANLGIFEEAAKGDFERECMEQKCNKGELYEALENVNTEFWEIKDYKLAVTNPCELQTSKPCLNAENCSVGLIRRCFSVGTITCKNNVDTTPYFECNCKKGYTGKFCEKCKFEFYCENGTPENNYCVQSSRFDRHNCKACDEGFIMRNKKCEKEKFQVRLQIPKSVNFRGNIIQNNTTISIFSKLWLDFYHSLIN